MESKNNSKRHQHRKAKKHKVINYWRKKLLGQNDKGENESSMILIIEKLGRNCDLLEQLNFEKEHQILKLLNSSKSREALIVRLRKQFEEQKRQISQLEQQIEDLKLWQSEYFDAM